VEQQQEDDDDGLIIRKERGRDGRMEGRQV
jgi:hypothetical protein